MFTEEFNVKLSPHVLLNERGFVGNGFVNGVVVTAAKSYSQLQLNQQ